MIVMDDVNAKAGSRFSSEAQTADITSGDLEEADR